MLFGKRSHQTNPSNFIRNKPHFEFQKFKSTQHGSIPKYGGTDRPKAISPFNFFEVGGIKRDDPDQTASSEVIWSGSALFSRQLLLIILEYLLLKLLYTLSGVWERSGSVVECLTRDRVAAGSSLTGVTALYPWARHTNFGLVLVQPRKTCPYITEILLMERKE